ncbi:50S ribosomal protein L32 [Candidatus Acetothermia bacterium]|nr:50S ribosomal protein L32 [Candidatus Acetothermia bacterium]MBI3659093.1 50S ribosomal protein L32 [Candidatus Acetothermia bacterium]
MGVPKKRRSSSEKAKHRGYIKLARVTISECSHCHQPKLPHRVCENCGYYDGKEVIAMMKDEDEKKGKK